MDILVKWIEGTENIVSASQIQRVNKSDSLKRRANTKMYWKPEKRNNILNILFKRI
nr:unnamed protein product [Callosobruchus analis]